MIGLDEYLDNVEVVNSIKTQVRAYYEVLKKASDGYLFLRRDIIRPKGVLDSIKYFFSNRPYEMDAISSVLEERGFTV
jgi:hypothetical protein